MRFLVLLLLSGCVGDFVEETNYPCRKQEDCVAPYVCDAVRYICVETSSTTAFDAGRLHPPD